MVPALRTPGATNAAKPPEGAVMFPRLTMDAFGRPGMLKLYLPAMKSSLRMSLVVARKPAVLMLEWAPNRMPSPLTMKTRPLAVRVPSRDDGPCPAITRLSAVEELLACLKVVV